MGTSTTVYCTIQDVQRWVKRVQFSETTKVTLSDVEAFIQSVSLIVDGELRKLGVSLPIASSATETMGILKTLVSYEAACSAEQSANFGANAKSSSHGEWLHQRYLDLLDQIQQNPCLLSDVVTASVRQMKSDTEDMNEDGTKEGDEIFTKKHIDDFRDDNKVLTPSEKSSDTESITGDIDRIRV